MQSTPSSPSSQGGDNDRAKLLNSPPYEGGDKEEVNLINDPIESPTNDLTEVERKEVVSQFGNVPAFFIEYQGQTADEVKYYFKGSDTVYFTDEGVVFQKTVRSQESRVGACCNVPLQGFQVTGVIFRDERCGEAVVQGLAGLFQ